MLTIFASAKELGIHNCKYVGLIKQKDLETVGTPALAKQFFAVAVSCVLRPGPERGVQLELIGTGSVKLLT